jgi:hypothetical protein
MSRKEYTFKTFLKDRSNYLTFFFKAPHWVGLIIYLLLGFSNAFIEGLILGFLTVYLMYLIRKKKVLEGSIKPEV